MVFKAVNPVRLCLAFYSITYRTGVSCIILDISKARAIAGGWGVLVTTHAITIDPRPRIPTCRDGAITYWPGFPQAQAAFSSRMVDTMSVLLLLQLALLLYTKPIDTPWVQSATFRVAQYLHIQRVCPYCMPQSYREGTSISKRTPTDRTRPCSTLQQQ